MNLLKDTSRPVIEILLVEDNPADVRLTREVLAEGSMLTNLSVVGDGDDALAYLRAQGRFADRVRPRLILLDLNLPRRDGRDVLAIIKNDPDLSRIPVVVLTTSKSSDDIYESYQLHANCYIPKPVDLQEFHAVIRTIEQFWLRTAMLPNGSH